ncbi:MAG: LysE family translocator [Methylobacterium sp.]|jgi:threonine/homoserine/homoserine lactone efflux protein|nr:LysE family translocator [Methylobacterium sp.]MCE2932104.1 LysE family translocator [Hyphomicrobiales bacterium]MCZ8269216.1 LysE family translocator [Beijerinckiaceae bacterium]MCA3636192.1 LysE family translocator [Methylobacterium sp.]MCA3638687.1 LysE family translocator [Methylobacterium sp.]
MTIEFWITTFIVVASPGTGAVYTIATGLGRGGRASVLAAFACTLGIIPHLAAAMMGLAALLHASALLFDLVKYAGVAYLLWMAWQILREKGAMRISGEDTERSARRVIIDGIALNLLNPKLSIFFVAFLPQFMSKDAMHPILEMLALSGVFMGMTFVIFALYGLFAAAMRDHVITRPAVMAWLRRGFAAAFVALGARLAVQER